MKRLILMVIGLAALMLLAGSPIEDVETATPEPSPTIDFDFGATPTDCEPNCPTVLNLTRGPTARSGIRWIPFWGAVVVLIMLMALGIWLWRQRRFDSW